MLLHRVNRRRWLPCLVVVTALGAAGCGADAASGEQTAACEPSSAPPFPANTLISLPSGDTLNMLVDLSMAGVADVAQTATDEMLERTQATLEADEALGAEITSATVRLVIVNSYNEYNKPILSDVEEVLTAQLRRLGECWGS